MERLHPKAVWLFFLKSFFSYVFLGGFLMVFTFTPAFLRTIFSRFSEIEGSTMPFNFIWQPFLVLIVLALFDYAVARLTYHFYRFELTEDTYRAERGIIWKRYISIPYDRIQNVDIYRGIWDRILGLSDIQIHTAGYGGTGARGMGSEGRLPGLDKERAEEVRDILISKVKEARGQGL